MKKNLFFILLLALVLTSMPACSFLNKEETTEETTEKSSRKKKKGKGTETTAEESTEESSKKSKSKGSGSKSSGSVFGVDGDEIYNNDGIVITTLGMSVEDYLGPIMEYGVQNDSDNSVSVSVSNVSVNGFMMSAASSAVDVRSGRSVDDDITFYDSDLTLAEIDTISEIEFDLYIMDSSTYDKIDEVKGIKISTGEGSATHDVDSSAGIEIFNQDGIRLVALRQVSDDYYGTAVVIYAENNSDVPVYIYTTEGAVVDGTDVMPFYGPTLLPGKKSVNTLSFSMDDYSPFEVEHISNINISFELLNAETYDTISNIGPLDIKLD